MYISKDQIAALPSTRFADGYAKKAVQFFSEYYTCHAQNGTLLESAKNQFDFLDTLFDGYYLHNGRLFVHSIEDDKIVELSPVTLLLHIRADIKNKKHPLFGNKFYQDGGIDGTYQKQVCQSKRTQETAAQTAEEFKQSRLQRIKTIDDLLKELTTVTNVKNLAELVQSYTTALSEEDEKTYQDMLQKEELEKSQLAALTVAFGADKAKTILAEIKASGKI